ncbi:cell division protein FtsK [Microbacterium protaetiae]|uniref:Cell division protein FtsK n=1 Tax=Microbacterium protaetiae TaxID=2509458 RepID=A0A4P6ECF8_9MICO|nr:FtsK/SpoIIIE domain-containing protein [Microbacterium protaetiae]QAY58689.1 cell division protein FtsK [Microbacterium protaetiae]
MTDVLDVADVLRLPDAPPPVRRSAIPLVASLVPVLAAVGLWLVTGTVTMLWFAALGPLIALASVADGARAARRQRRLAARDAERSRRRVRSAVAVRHDAERERLWAQTPDMRGLVVPDDDIDPVWRGQGSRDERLVVGRGRRASTVRVEGGRADAASAAVRDEASTLDDAPITVPLRGGVAVVGPEPLARAVVRALVLQACLALPPDRLRLGADPVAVDDPDGAWLRALPHVGTDAATTLVLDAREAGDAAIVRVSAGADVPPRCAAVLTLTGVDRARLAHDGTVTEVQIEGVSREQAVALAERLRERARASFGAAGPGEVVALADIVDRSPAGAGLDVVVGTARGGAFRLDLAADGPHALVAGITGSGKSELLTTWITALCTRFAPDRVVFLLADFKGGTAFDALAALPHVTGVITDLDAGGAARALASLRAELRRREAEIVRAGARDITGTQLPRLVIVVDEFAALAAAHPDLVDLFTDIAARGRALGMHLILGTQRAAGVFRESLLANCPLRISLRVADAADSRALIGGDEAAALSGAPDQRGIALIRRAVDVAARPVRIALASSQLVDEAARAAVGAPPRRPWLPALPERLALADVGRRGDGRPDADVAHRTENALHADNGHRAENALRADGRRRADAGRRAENALRAENDLRADDVVLGIADEPEHQRQPPVMLTGRGLGVIGRAGSGRTSVLATIAAQDPTAQWIGSDPEAAWDRALALESGGTAATVLLDDVDALLARYPIDYAQAFADRLERIIHTGQGRVILSLQRMAGPAGRLVELLPQRALLATTTRTDFAAAGGVPHDWHESLPPGRGILDGRLVQFALPPTIPSISVTGPRPWRPCVPLTAAIAPAGAVQRHVAAVAAAAGSRVLTIDKAGTAADTPDDVPVVVVGDGEQWQRAWRLLQTIRADGEIVVDAASAADYRLLTGDRALPPYCVPGRDRAWLLRADGSVQRVVLTADHL